MNLELFEIPCLVVHLDFEGVDFEKLGTALGLVIAVGAYGCVV